MSEQKDKKVKFTGKVVGHNITLVGVLLLLTFLVCSCGGISQHEPLGVLILSGRNNHDWQKTTPELKKIYEDSGRFAVDVTNEPNKCNAETFAKYDVVVSNWCAWPDVTGRQWGPKTEKALLDFIRSGKGFVLFHAAGATFHDWPEYQQLIGATWDLEKTGHAAYGTFEVTISDKNHPVTDGMKDFWTTDELWHRMATQPTMNVLCKALSAEDKNRKGVWRGTGKYEPMVIYTNFGRGRCFYNILGHDVRAMQNVGWRTLMLRGTEWAATGKVTIPIPDDWPTTAAATKETSRQIDDAYKLQEPSTAKKTTYNWRQTDTSLALLNHRNVVWQFNYKREEGKPYFHPVALTDGTELTWLRPPDHRWHQALWFSWKHINGLNYWEEDSKTNLPEGRTEVVEVKVTPHKDYSARIEMSLSYHPPDKPAVLTEKRLITVGTPDKTGRYYIDWRSTFTAGKEDVLLNRTPLVGEEGGKEWGGYAGLSVRLAKAIGNWKVIDSQGRKGLGAHGKKARWLDFSGETAVGKAAGIAIFDHPANPRHPPPWFVIMDEKVPFGYFNPAVLFYRPYSLPAGQSLTLRYRILIHPGWADKDLMQSEWRELSTLKD